MLREAREVLEQARPPGRAALDPVQPSQPRERDDTPVRLGITRTRRRVWDGGSHRPEWALGRWLRKPADRMWLVTEQVGAGVDQQPRRAPRHRISGRTRVSLAPGTRGAAWPAGVGSAASWTRATTPTWVPTRPAASRRPALATAGTGGGPSRRLSLAPPRDWGPAGCLR